MHEENMIDTKAAEKRVDAILHEPAKPPRKRRSDAGKPKAKKPRAPSIGVTIPITLPIEDWRAVADVLWEDYPGVSDAIRRELLDELIKRLDSLTARKEG